MEKGRDKVPSAPPPSGPPYPLPKRLFSGVYLPYWKVPKTVIYYPLYVCM